MTRNLPSEIELLKASLRGETAAFEVIVQKYQPLICAITYSATGSVEKSQELAQQAFVKGWKNLNQLKDLSRFRTWLCSITRNLVHDSYRRKKNDVTSKAIPMDSIQDHPSEDKGPIEAAINKERESIVNEALSKIPEIFREPLVLYYREDRSYRQVAEQLGFSEHTARERISQARNLLKERVASLVEETIERTKPGKVFTSTVVASITGLAAIKGSGVATAAGIAATSSTSGIATRIAAVMSGITARIITIAAVVAVGVGTIVVYKHVTKSERSPDLPQPEWTTPEQREEQDKVKEELTKQPNGEMSTLSTIDETKGNSNNGKSTLVLSQSIPDKESEYKFVPKGVLSGLITDADTGEPIANTEVRITCGRIYHTKTDEHGFYLFDKIEKSDNYKISINSWDHVGIDFNADRPPTIRLQNDKHVVRHFQLKKACMVELTVKDEDSMPLEDAEIFVSRLADSRGWPVGAEESGGNGNRTNKEGFVLLGGFPPNDTYFITIQHSYSVRVEGRKNFWTHRFDYAPTGLEVFLEDPNVTEVMDVVLKKGQKVRGYAQYQDGEPADDITIVPKPEWWHSDRWIPSFEVDPNGFFTLEHVVPGTYNIQARIPQGDGWSGRKVLQTQLPPAGSDILYVNIPFTSPKNLTSISGTIEWIGEKRPRYIEIVAYSPASGRHSVQIWDFDKNTFLVDRLEPGTYRLSVEGDFLEPVTIDNVQAPSENLVLQLTCAEKPRLYGKVVDVTSKKPLGEFELRVRKLETLRGPGYSQSDQWFTFEGNNGAFEIEVVGPGIYDIQAKAEGYAPTWSQRINTDENSEVVINLYAGGGSIKGQVLNEDGKPIDGATVIPLSKASGTSYSTRQAFVSEEGAVRTNQTGEYLLTGLPSGFETLKIIHPDYAYVIKDDIEVKAGQCTGNINVILPKGGIIEGMVYNQNGEPQGGVTIYAQDEIGHITTSNDPSILATAISDPNGFYRITGLPEEVCYLIRQDEWDTFGVVRRTVAPQYGKTMHVDFGGTNMVTGQVILEGIPLANQKVIISSPYIYYTGFLKAVVKTDSEGRFVCLGMDPGNYGVFYEMNRKRSDWFRLTEFEMDSAYKDLGIIPKEFSILYLAVQQPAGSPWDISSIYFKSETRDSSVAIPYEFVINSNQPYKVGPVPPGRYSISVYRSDNTSYTKKIEIPQEDKEVTETILLPEGNSAIYGTIADGIDSIVLQSIDESIQGYIRKNDEGRYKISHLPAGEYCLGFYPLKKDNAIAFSLLPKQSLEFHIDPSLFDFSATAVLASVSIVSETGAPCNNALAYLSANGKIIEPEREFGWRKVFIVAPDHYLLHISCEDYQDVQKEISIKPVPPGENPNIKQNRILIRLTR